MERRIYPPEAFEGILDKLVDNAKGEKVPIFETKAVALVFAAALGYREGKRTIVNKKGSGIRFDIFEKAEVDVFFNALSVVEKQDLKILSTEHEEERATIFEEYAHTGLIRINKECFESTGDPVDTLVRMTDEARSTADPDVPGMDPDILRKMLK